MRTLIWERWPQFFTGLERTLRAIERMNAAEARLAQRCELKKKVELVHMIEAGQLTQSDANLQVSVRERASSRPK